MARVLNLLEDGRIFLSQEENGTWNIFVRREEGRELRKILTKQDWKESEVKREGSKVKRKRRLR